MGVRNYLVEGLSGAGKTTVAEALEQRGYHVIHGDRVLAYVGDPKTGARLQGPPRGSQADNLRWRHDHWIWHEDKVRALAADHRHAVTFFCGGSRNHVRYINLFDAIFILEVTDLNTLLKRLVGKGADEFGGTRAERAFVADLHSALEDVPARAVSIDAKLPVAQVVEAILLICADV